MNSNFLAFWLAPVTRNILGYLLFCDRSHDGFSFRDTFGRRNLCHKWSNRTNNTTNTLACQCSLVGRKLFSCWICSKIVRCTWQNPRNVCELKTKFLLSDVFNLQKVSIFQFYPTDLNSIVYRGTGTFFIFREPLTTQPRATPMTTP